MPLREFSDPSGERWRVWDTVPERAGGMGDFRDGWLTFDNGTERRRLAPVPDGWSDYADNELLDLLDVAHAHHRGGGSVRTAPRPEAERRIAERRQGDRRGGDRRRMES